MHQLDTYTINQLLKANANTAKVFLYFLTFQQSLKIQQSVKRIAKACSISEVTAVKALKELKSMNLLTSRRQRSPNRANLYILRGTTGPDTCDKQAQVLEADPFKHWFRTQMSPEHYAKIRELYGIGFSQMTVQKYFETHVLPTMKP